MELFAVSDDTILAIAKDLIQLLGTIFAGIIAYYMAKLNRKASEASSVVKEVATDIKSGNAMRVEIKDATDETNALISKQ